MMGFIHAAVAVLSLLSFGQSAPVTSCETLIQPLEIQGREQLLGKWMHAAESTENKDIELMMKTFQESYWMKITAANEQDAVALTHTTKAFGFCVTAAIKMTLANSTLQSDVTNVTLKHTSAKPVLTFNTTNLLKTGCSDCLLLQSQNCMFGKTLRGLLLLSKRKTLNAAELEEFRKQAECLNLPQPFSLNPEGGVCPEPPSQETEITDVPHIFLNGQMSDFRNITEKIVNSVGGLENFLKMVSDVLSKKD